MANCFNESAIDSHMAKFDISNECALFDFAVYTVIAGTCCVLGVAGNTLSFVVLYKDPVRTPTSFILQALAVADTLVLLSATPLYTLSPVYTFTGFLKGYYDLHISIMPFLWPIYLIPYTGTILLTVLVSLNRYEAVCRPFQATKICSEVNIRRHVLYIALFSVLYNIPRFFEYEKVEICTGYNTTMEVFEMSGFGGNMVYRIVYGNILYFLVMHGGPLLSLAFLNANLIRALKLQARKRTEMNMAGYQQDITLVLVVVVCVFICCQTPTFVDHILWTVLNNNTPSCGQWHYYYTAIGDLMAILNSSVNFVIYVLTSPKFRQNLLGTLRVVCSRRTIAPRIRSGKSETILLCPGTNRHEREAV